MSGLNRRLVARIQKWYVPEESWTPPITTQPFNPASSWVDSRDDQQDRVTTVLWVNPPSAVGSGTGVEFDPSLSFVDVEERQQDRPTGVIWYVEPDPMLGDIPRASVGTTPTVDFGWDGSGDRWQDAQRYPHTDDDIDGFPTPQPNAYAGSEIGWDAAGDRDQTQHWYDGDAFGAEPATAPRNIPTLASGPAGPYHVTLVWTDPAGGSSALVSVNIYCNRDGLSTFATAVLLGTVPAGTQTFDDYFGDLDDFPVTATNLRYWAVGVNAEGLTGSPEWNSSGLRWTYPHPEPDAQQSPSNVQTWFAPDEQALAPTPPIAPAPSGLDFGRDDQQDGERVARWFAPDEQQAGFAPLAAAYAGAEVGWDIQQDRGNGQQWYAPEASFDGFTTPPVLGVDATDMQQDRSIQPVWAVVADESAAFVQTVPTVATVAQQAGMYGWDAQMDRSNQPVWFIPDEDFYPLSVLAIVASGRPPEIRAIYDARPSGIAFDPRPSGVALDPRPTIREAR